MASQEEPQVGKMILDDAWEKQQRKVSHYWFIINLLIFIYVFNQNN